MEKISVLMVGTSGYGGIYLTELLHSPRAERFQIVGAVDPYAAQSKFAAELRERGIPVYDTLEQFYARHEAELAIIVTPTYLHAQMTVYCMEHGSHVLCEKPICASPEDAQTMIAARERTGRKLAIGFQWSHSEGILALKKDILNGVYGKVRQFRSIVYYPRDLSYYHRSTGWAGKRKTASGQWLLDSVASNATAHFLHNMLFLTGPQMDRSAEPAAIEAEVYKANPIEMFDTCAMRVHTGSGAELLFYATHAVPMDQTRWADFDMECELGRVTLRHTSEGEIMTGHLNDGSTIRYASPGADDIRKLYCMADAIREDASLPCVAETALPHLECIWAMAQAIPETPEFAGGCIDFNEAAQQYTCRGLGEALDLCWKNGTLPYEEKLPWALQPHKIQL